MSQVTQDLPPKGGFPTIQFRRHLPKRGPTGFVFLTGLTALMTYGWYWNIQSIREKKELEREKIWSRIYLTPLLKAEADRDMVRRTTIMKQREGEIMKDVPNWNTDESVYHNKRYVAPRVIVLPE